jgi:hypothetical protein
MLLWIRELEYERSCIYSIFFYKFHITSAANFTQQVNIKRNVFLGGSCSDPSVTTNQSPKKLLVSENETTGHAAIP